MVTLATPSPIAPRELEAKLVRPSATFSNPSIAALPTEIPLSQSSLPLTQSLAPCLITSSRKIFARSSGVALASFLASSFCSLVSSVVSSSISVSLTVPFMAAILVLSSLALPAPSTPLVYCWRIN